MSNANKRNTLYRASAAITSTVKMVSETPTGPGGATAAWTRMALRFLQFVLGLTVCGLYGTDLHTATQKHASMDPGWVYAVTVAGMSCVTCLVYFAPVVKSWVFWPWDLLLFILWTAVFGNFARIFLHANPKDFKPGFSPSYARMHNGIWVDLVNMLLWFITGTWAAVVFCMHRKRSLHTGRAEV
jgi:hypothetical protein